MCEFLMEVSGSKNAWQSKEKQNAHANVCLFVCSFNDVARSCWHHGQLKAKTETETETEFELVRRHTREDKLIMESPRLRAISSYIRKMENARY
jgi:hypothetical protein